MLAKRILQMSSFKIVVVFVEMNITTFHKIATHTHTHIHVYIVYTIGYQHIHTHTHTYTNRRSFSFININIYRKFIIFLATLIYMKMYFSNSLGGIKIKIQIKKNYYPVVYYSILYYMHIYMML